MTQEQDPAAVAAARDVREAEPVSQPATENAAAKSDQPAKGDDQSNDTSEFRKLAAIADNEDMITRAAEKQKDDPDKPAFDPLVIQRQKLIALREAMQQVDKALEQLGAARLEDYMDKYAPLKSDDMAAAAAAAAIPQLKQESSEASTSRKRPKPVAEHTIDESAVMTPAEAAAMSKDSGEGSGSTVTRLPKAPANPGKKRKIKHFVLQTNKSYVSQLYEYMQGSAGSLVSLEWDARSYHVNGLVAPENLRHVVKCKVDGEVHELTEGYKTLKMAREAMAKKILVERFGLRPEAS